MSVSTHAFVGHVTLRAAGGESTSFASSSPSSASVKVPPSNTTTSISWDEDADAANAHSTCDREMRYGRGGSDGGAAHAAHSTPERVARSEPKHAGADIGLRSAIVSSTEPQSEKTFHRRPLPPHLVAFGSAEGRKLLVESLAAGTAESFHSLVSHLHTQASPEWCGLGTLVTVLNALEIDPGRVWKGPWRFFGEELLVCCKALEIAASDGLTLAEVACLAECNGADSTRFHAEDVPGLDRFRAALGASVRAADGPFIIANYDRRVLDQSGTGHFSPLAALHEPSDRVLVLDVARFKYPPHWVPLEAFWRAMASVDSESQRSRGYLVVGRATDASRTEGPEGLDELLAHLRTLGAPIKGLPIPDDRVSSAK